MIDTNAVLSEYLKSTGTPLYALVGARVYCPRLPAKYANAQAAVEFMRAGGTSKLEHEEHAPRFHVKCYGGSMNDKDADTLYRALHDRLQNAHGEDVASGTIMSAEEEVMGQPIEDPETKWPYVLSIWRVTMRPAA